MSVTSETIYQELLAEAKPLIHKLSNLLGDYHQGVAMVGLGFIIAAHAKMHEYDATTWLALILRAGMNNWPAEDTIAAVDAISLQLHESYRELSKKPACIN